jgi:adenylate kinase
MQIIIITGPPYCGKGTQCDILKQELQFRHISTGDLIRQEKADGTELGHIMAGFTANGSLVPDDIVTQLVDQLLDKLQQDEDIILDGYPRTVPQAKAMAAMAQAKGKQITKVINIDVPHEELLLRAKKRAETSDREDDRNVAVHFKRINIFEQDTRPAITYMQSVFDVVTIDGMGSVADIAAKIREGLASSSN